MFLTVTVLCELLPLAFGTGHAARVDWAFPYITLRFVVLPVSAVALAIWGAAAFVSRVRHGRDALRLVPPLLVPLLFLGVSWFAPLPWLSVLVHGEQSDVPGWLR
jgi:hypothetical protein